LLYKIIKSDYTQESGFCNVPLQQLPVLADDESSFAPGISGMPAKVDSEARKLIKEARSEAEEILRQAKVDAEAMKAEAFKKGLEESSKERISLLEEARDVLAAAAQMRIKILSSAEPQVVELALSIAGHLLHTRIHIDPELIKDVVAEAILMLASGESIVVRVNPRDLSVCRSHKEIFQELLADGASIKFLPSEEVKKGDCTVQGQYALVESFLQERFNHIRDALLKEAAYAPAPLSD